MTSRRCRHMQLGPFLTEWRCLLNVGHDEAHVYELDLWPAAGGPTHPESAGLEPNR